MIYPKNFSLLTRVVQIKCDNIFFQGHYINRSVNDVADQCQCNTAYQQKRTFLINPQQSRKREYRGRQLVGYSMDQMFEVVSDVENYNRFVPWCTKSIIKSRAPGKLKAELMVGFPPIKESYISNVTHVHPHLVKAECLDGRLFHYLLTLWRFSPGLKREKQSCVVDFQITFEFKSAFHSQLSNLFFDQVARRMESAFIAEVGRRNGPSTMPPRNLLIDREELKS